MSQIEVSRRTYRVWQRFQIAHRRIDEAIGRVLSDQGLPPALWFDVLTLLLKSSERRLRPQDIEKQLLLPQYGLSRLLDRMQQQRAIKRERCQDDRRGQWIVLTQEGKELHEKISSSYNLALMANLGECMDADTLKKFNKILKKFISSTLQHEQAD